MSSKYKPGDNGLPHFITFSVVEWIDALTRKEYKDILVESFQYCIREKSMQLHAWVIMSNHVHLIMSTIENSSISDILRDLKKYTSKQIFKAITENPGESRKQWMVYLFERAGKRNCNNKFFQFWQQSNHPIELNSHYLLKQKMDYLHENPVKAGIVYEPQDYIYSSAIDYYTTKKGLIPIEPI